MALLKRSIAGLLIALLAMPALAASVQLAEQKIKAGMIYNFLKYAEWPAAGTSTPMRVCIVGSDPLQGNLKPMVGRSVNQRKIAVVDVDAAEAAGSCDMLMVGKGAPWPVLRQAIAGKPILTVSDDINFIKQGGMFAFGRTHDRITVTLNMDAAEAAQLQMQPRLLNLVTVVRAGTAGGQ